jgi:hypothetical protein
LTLILVFDLICGMKRNVACLELFGKPVAIVEVARAELGSQEREQQFRLKFAQLPQFQGVQVCLGVPHEGPLEANFSAPQLDATALKKIGWIRLPWKPVELPL